MKQDQILRIGFQGEKGAYSEKAIETLYADLQTDKAAYHTSYDVVEALKKRKIDFGLLPVENSIIGNITHSYDLLLENRLNIVKEIIIPIHHSLLAYPGAELWQIERIYSHPAAISQCEVFLRDWSDKEIIPTYDTAGSAKMIAEKCLRNTAAIASEEAARLYNLTALRQNIEDYPHNQTRFLLLSINPGKQEHNKYLPWKVTAVFDTLDEHGQLHSCLGVFEKYKVNLSMLHSRPHKSEPWKYHFYVDIDGHADDENIAAAFDEIRRLTGFLHIFGSYPRYVRSE